MPNQPISAVALLPDPSPAASVPVIDPAQPRRNFRLDAAGFRALLGTGERTAATVLHGDGVYRATAPRAGSYAETIIGDGIRREFAVEHDLGTTDVAVTVRDPLDRNAEVPTVDNLAPTPDLVIIQLIEPLPFGVPLRILVRT